MYRFKTKKEFEDEFGVGWKTKVDQCWSLNGDMDYLFGKEITYEEWNNIQTSDSFDAYWFGSTYKYNWSVSKDMVTDKPLPNSFTPINLLDCHGWEFQADYDNKQVVGKITVENWRDDKNRVFLCQNVNSGADCKEKHGYKYSFVLPEENEHQLDYIDSRGFKNFKLLNNNNYVKESSKSTEVCRPHSQGEPRGTTVGIHSKPITITRGSRFIGSEATNRIIGTKACQGKVIYNGIQSI